VTDDLAAFPSTIELSRTQPVRRYTRHTDLIAVHGPLPGGIAASEGETLAPGITLVPAALAAQVGPGARVSPVYVLRSGGQPQVPTGRVLVRFAEDEQAEAHRDDIERAGYRLVASPGYAPHAGWVESATGPATALQNLGRLESLPGLVHFEPELVGRQARRS
jgi:hypothetical protein